MELMMRTLLNQAFCLRLLETFGHFLWQGAAIGMLMWLINRLSVQVDANRRYLLNLIALCLMAICVPATFLLVPTRPGTSSASGKLGATPVNTVRLDSESLSEPVNQAVNSVSAQPQTEQPKVTSNVKQVGTSEENVPGLPEQTSSLSAKSFWKDSVAFLRHCAPYMTVAYLIGVAAMMSRLLIAIRGGQRLRRASQAIDDLTLLSLLKSQVQRLGMKWTPVISTCSRVSGPVVVGILKPMILLPQALIAGMSAQELEAVLAHELAHIQRHDLIINLFQRLVEAVLFFHPAIWYVSRRVSAERENCCDDLVMKNGCDRLTYAHALLRAAELTQTSRHGGLQSATALAATGHNLSEFKRRLLRVVGQPIDQTPRLTRSGVCGFSLIMLLCLTLPFVLQSCSPNPGVDWQHVNGASYERDDQIVLAKYTDDQVLALVITTFPEDELSYKMSSGSSRKPESWNAWLHFDDRQWGSRGLRFELDSEKPDVARFIWTDGRDRREQTLSLEKGRIFYCDIDANAIEQRPTLKDKLPLLPEHTSPSKQANAQMVQLAEAQFLVAEPLQETYTNEQFVDAVVEQVLRPSYAIEWQAGNAEQFSRWVVQKTLPKNMSQERCRKILEALRVHVDDLIARQQGEIEEMAYCRRPNDVLMLLWRISHAVRRRPLSAEAQSQLDGQWMQIMQLVERVGVIDQQEIATDAYINQLNVRRADPMSPLFKHPLPASEFQTALAMESNFALYSAKSAIVSNWFFAEARADSSFLQITGDPSEKIVSHGHSNGILNIGYQSTSIWWGDHNAIDGWSTFVDLSQQVPGNVSLDPPQSVIDQGDAAVRKWVQSSTYQGKGHITLDSAKRRLFGVRGTRFLELDVDSFQAADQLDAVALKERAKQADQTELLLGKPQRVDLHDLTYNKYVAVLTEVGELYVMKVEELDTLGRMLTYHIRHHNPPRPLAAPQAESVAVQPEQTEQRRVEKGIVAGTIILEDGSAPAKPGLLEYSVRQGSNGTSGNAAQPTSEFSVSLETGEMVLVYYLDGYAPAWTEKFTLQPGETRDDIRFVMKPGRSAKVKVVDEQGLPISNATLYAIPEIHGSGGGPVYEKETDQNGEYLYQHLAQTPYKFNVKAPGFQPLRTDPLEIDPEQGVTLTMARCQPTTGQVLNADGTPAVGAKLRALDEVSLNGGSNVGYSSGGDGWWGEVFAVTNGEGRFVLNQLSDNAKYLFLIESADGARCIEHLQSNEEVTFQLPKRRDLIVTLKGDLTGLRTRRGKPYALIRQRVRFYPKPKSIVGDLLGDDVPIEITPEGGRVILRGVVSDDHPGASEQKIRVSVGNVSEVFDLNPDGDTAVTLNLDNDMSE